VFVLLTRRFLIQIKTSIASLSLMMDQLTVLLVKVEEQLKFSDSSVCFSYVFPAVR